MIKGLRKFLSSRPAERQARSERFGAILQLRKPRALVFVDRQYARSLDMDGGELWNDPREDGEIGRSPLAAPLEAHLQITNRCDAGCKGCYTAASPKANQTKHEWALEEWKIAIDELARMGVFHLALGGGESADLPWLGDLAEHARARGLVPNLTTSGLSNLDRVIDLAPLFGQINISLDGMRESYRKVRGFDGFDRADSAIRRLRKRKRKVGINVVVTRHNFGELDEILRYARQRRLNEVELLRFKPAGRGIQAFAEMTCTDAQHRAFLPLVLQGSKRNRLRVRVDCSYLPMLAHHNPSLELLRSLSVYGCTGGDFLIGAKANGAVTACSFAQPPQDGPTVDSLHEYWQKQDAFGVFRDWRRAEEPCRSCEYHEICRGGCKVVSRHLAGDASAPDPECPRVVDWRQKAGDLGKSDRSRGRHALPVVM